MANQTMETDSQYSDWMNSIKTLLESVDYDQLGYSDCIVPQVLKKSNEDTYRPRVVSIGPQHKGSREESEDMVRMEEIKLRCILSLVHRAGGDGEALQYQLIKCSRAIWELDGSIRASYATNIELAKHEFTTIMLVDGCFLLELLITKGLDDVLPSRLFPPGPAPQLLKDDGVLSDLILLENQIPIFVLHELSRTLFPDVFTENREQRATRINNLALYMLGYHQLRVQSLEAATNILDLVHFFVNRTSGDHEEYGNHHVVVDIIMDTDQPRKLKLKRCALRLLAAGFTIKLPEEGRDHSSWLISWLSSLWNCFAAVLIWLRNNILVTTKQQHLHWDEEARGLDFDFKFKAGKLEIAQLHITETTKAKWCNVIAWEHYIKKKHTSSPYGYHQSWSSTDDMTPSTGKFTSAALIFNGLICCADDVQLLKDKSIIIDHLKMSNEELEAFLRTISVGVDHRVVDSRYVKMVDDLNQYPPAFFLQRIWKTVLNSYKYREEWAIKFMNRNYNFVATVLAVLSVVQTAYTVLAYYMSQ